MRIAFWSKGILRGYGGAEVCAAQLLNALCRRGETCFLLAHYPDRGAPATRIQDLDSRITIHQGHFANPLDNPRGPLDFLSRTVRYLGSAIALLAWLSRNRVQVIHQHFVNLDVLMLLAFRPLLRYRLVVTFHGMELQMAEGKRLASWKNRVALRHADHVTAVSPQQCAALRELGGGREVHYVPNGLDYDEIVELVNADPEAPVEPGHFVFCGRFAPVKQVPQLIDAFADAVRQGCTRNLYLVGDGYERDIVRDRIERLGLADRVIPLGRRPRQQALRLIRDGLCLVLNSSSEGYPIVILEAMALGKPVIAPRVGGVGEMLSDGENSMLFAAGDSSALIDCLLRMDRQTELARRLGERAGADCRRLAGLDAVLDRYLRLYPD